jgi:hypothetical protein
MLSASLLKEDGMKSYNDATQQNLTETRRQRIFLVLVTAQDQNMGVAKSRQLIARQFGITEDDVRNIEREGIDNNWPPL